jgi:chloramphenicol 3-O-phosphotransferase
MKQVFIILRGAPASGKTTIGESLRDFDKKIVWFKTDNIKPFFSNFEDRTLDVVMGTSLATLNYLLDEGYSVIYDGIFKKPEYTQRAIDLAKSKNIPTVIYQLTCSLKTLQERDKTRKGVKEGCRKPLGDEIIESLFNKVENNPIEGSIKLNTEEKSIEECLEIIKKNFD